MATADGVATAALVKERGGAYSLDHVVALSLRQAGLHDVAVLQTCVGLTRLDLSHNRLAHARPLGRLPALATLDLSHNVLTDLRGLADGPAGRTLHTLHLRHNPALALAAVTAELPPALGRLQVLSLDGCAAASEAGCLAAVAQAFPALLCLDTTWLGGSARAATLALDRALAIAAGTPAVAAMAAGPATAAIVESDDAAAFARAMEAVAAANRRVTDALAAAEARLSTL